VQQHEEKRITPNTTTGELEAEALAEEKKEAYNPDPDITISLRGRQFTFPRSKADMIAELTAEHVIQMMEDEKTGMTQEAYLQMLVHFKQLIEEGTTKWLS
jgi:hypothetical protein